MFACEDQFTEPCENFKRKFQFNSKVTETVTASHMRFHVKGNEFYE